LSLLAVVVAVAGTTRTAVVALVALGVFALALWRCLLARRTRSRLEQVALEARPGQTLAIRVAIRCFRLSPVLAAAGAGLIPAPSLVATVALAAVVVVARQTLEAQARRAKATTAASAAQIRTAQAVAAVAQVQSAAIRPAQTWTRAATAATALRRASRARQ
jgi:hypothetical protein